MNEGSWAEWATAAVAAVALILSLLAFLASLRVARDARFFEIHNKLLSPEAQAGRRLMHQYQDRGKTWDWVFDHRRDDYDRITYALGLYQTLAQLARYRSISRRSVRRMWFGQIQRSWLRIEGYIAWRRRRFGFPGAWDDLVWLAQKTDATVTIPVRGNYPEVP